MRYDIMVDRVAEYLDRSDLGTSSSTTVSSEKIGNWINDTRKDIALKYDFNYLYVEATISTSAGTATYALPDDYLGHATILCDQKKLARIGAREFDELYYYDSDAVTSPTTLTITEESTTDASSGFPEYYIDRGMYFQLFPAPNGTFTITMKYFAQPADFTIGADEDYMSRFHFEAIIFGAALRGAVFLDDNAKISVFKQAYDQAIAEIIKREKSTKTTDTHVRIKTSDDYDHNTWKRLTRRNT